MPHVYYSIEATDLILPSDMKNRQEHGFGLKAIPAAVDARENPFDACFIMSKENKQKTNRELITLIKDFCLKLHDVSDDYTAFPYNRPTYKITMRRNAMVHIFDNDLGGVNFSNTMKVHAVNNGIFSFIYNRANRLIYECNIRDILGQDIQHIHVRQTSGIAYGSVAKNQEANEYGSSNINPNVPLYVYEYNDKEAYVEEIPEDTIIVNDKMCEIYPNVTGHIPAHMSLLFNNKTEPVKRAYGQRHRSH